MLGLLEWIGGGTPYDLKRALAQSVGNFWSVPHSQLYAEPERLERAGHLTAQHEQSGRRRKRYELTQRGRAALAEWRASPADDALPELRDPALLKLFMGADPASIAPARARLHAEKLEQYERLRTRDPGTGPRGPWLALDAGIAHERVRVRFWSGLADGREPD